MATCMFPFFKENPNTYFTQGERYIPFPCGRCPECLKRRSSIWSFRLKKEQEQSDSAYFVTLTYAPEFLPLSPNGFMSLYLPDLQKFFKRLRKKHAGKPIKYYAVGEYGGERRRPHYHCIILNAKEEDILSSWTDPSTNIPIGIVDCEPPRGGAIGYTIKYVNKGRWTPMHANDDRVPEFSVMSKGLGKSYISPSTVQYHRSSIEKAYIMIDDGVRIPIPRYYKQKMFQTETQKLDLVLQHPSILLHFEENKQYLKKQQVFFQKLAKEQNEAASQLDSREIFESRKNAIETFKTLYSKRKDL